MDNELFQATVLVHLETIEANTKPKASNAQFFGSSHGSVSVKSYDGVVKKWGGVENFGIACRQRMPGYPESVIGLIGAWDNEPVVIAFKADYPQLF